MMWNWVAPSKGTIQPKLRTAGSFGSKDIDSTTTMKAQELQRCEELLFFKIGPQKNQQVGANFISTYRGEITPIVTHLQSCSELHL